MTTSTTTPQLADAERHRAMRLSLAEGVLYALMVGGAETYFVADAVRIGATPIEIGLVIALPLLVGACGPLIALRALGWLGRRRPLVAAAAFAQATVLLTLASLQQPGLLTPPLLLALLCLYQITGQVAGIAWSSWYGDLVPSAIRGRYFAQRTRLVHFATFVGLVGGGTALHLLEPGVADSVGAGSGFAGIFAAAGLLRLCSAVLLARSPEPVFRGLPPPSRAFAYLYTARGRNAWKLIVGGAVFHLSVYASSPYFAPYMLEEIRLSYFAYMIALSSQVAAKVLVMPFWGRTVDRFGARHAYALALLCAALIPLPWLWVGALPGVVVAQICSGIAWSGHEVALFALLLESTSKRTRPLVFAAQNIVNGVGQVSGSAIGAALVGGGCYRAAFAVSLGARLLVAVTLPRLVHELRALPTRPPLLLRVVGFRPGAGVVHRPILERDESPETPSAQS